MEAQSKKLRFMITLKKNYFSVIRRYHQLEDNNLTYVVKEYNMNTTSLPESYKDYFVECFKREFEVMNSLLKKELKVVEVIWIEIKEEIELEYPIIKICMEDLPIGDLKNWRMNLPEMKSLTKENMFLVISLGAQMIEIVLKMHELNFLHRDIKPDNFLLKEKIKNKYDLNFFELVIADFENCIKNSKFEILEEYEVDINHYHIGSIFFRPPDLKKNYSTEWDIFSLGICLFHLFEGEFPYEPESSSFKDVTSELEKLQITKIVLKKYEEKKFEELFLIFEEIINGCTRKEKYRLKNNQLKEKLDRINTILNDLKNFI